MIPGCRVRIHSYISFISIIQCHYCSLFDSSTLSLNYFRSPELDQTYAVLTKTKKHKKNQPSVDLSSFKDALASIESMTKPSHDKTTAGKINKNAIGSGTAPSQAAQKVTSKKGRKNTAYVYLSYLSGLVLAFLHLLTYHYINCNSVKEILRFQKVLQHPAFKASPLATIQQHVKNTLETVQKSC